MLDLSDKSCADERYSRINPVACKIVKALLRNNVWRIYESRQLYTAWVCLFYAERKQIGVAIHLSTAVELFSNNITTEE